MSISFHVNKNNWTHFTSVRIALCHGNHIILIHYVTKFPENHIGNVIVLTQLIKENTFNRSSGVFSQLSEIEGVLLLLSITAMTKNL